MQDELKKENAEGSAVDLDKKADAETENLKVAEGISKAEEILAEKEKTEKEEAAKTEAEKNGAETSEETKEEVKDSKDESVEETKEDSKEEAKEEAKVELNKESEEKTDNTENTDSTEGTSTENKEENKEENKDASADLATDKLADQSAEGASKDAPAEGGSAAVATATTPAAAQPVNQPVKKNGVGRKIYSWLNSGVSHTLPFVIGGGILITLAFIIDTISGYSSAGGSEFGSATPAAAILKYMGELAMGMVIPILAGYIAKAIAGKPGLAVGFAGGVLASLGNASLMGYSFYEGTLVDGKFLDGFSEVLTKWAFEQPYGGYTGSGFLGGIAAGFLAGFIVLGLQKACEDIPDSAEAVKTTIIYPIVGILLVGLVMCFILNPLIGLINEGLVKMLTNLSDSGMVAFLGLILGAMIAIDLDGPFNKAAYAFGIRMLTVASVYGTSGVDVDDATVQAFYIAMAAIMVGAMVPPVGVGMASLIFSKKFTKEERCSAIPNFLMGISAITEGAVPIAAADPLRVIPCCMVGAGVAGFLVAQFKCTLTVPFGGLFVITSVGNPIVFIVAWLVGSAITCVMLGLLKKTVDAE